MEQNTSFIDPTRLTKWVRFFLYFQIVLAVIALISTALEYQLLIAFKNGVYAVVDQAMAAGEKSDERQLAIGISQLIAFAISAIFILKWIYRANYNARQLGAVGMRFSPWWSILWYFVPIFSLWKPYQAMKEIWKASSYPQDWAAQPTPYLLDWWWFFLIVDGALGNAVFSMASSAKEIDTLMTASMVHFLSDITGVVLNLIFLSVVTKVCAMQISGYRKAHP